MKSVFSLKLIADSWRKNAQRFSASESSLQTTNYKLQTTKGFSLIELLVSMALFIVVLTIGIGALLVLISTNLKAQNMQEAVGNVQFALDSMAREIRTGYSYYCTSSTPASTPGGVEDVSPCSRGTYLSVIEGGASLTEGQDFSSKRIEYRYNASSRAIERRIPSQSSTWVRLTSPSVYINSMHFNVNGTAQKQTSSDESQPNVTIFISGTVTGISNTSSTFTLQTTVTQRVLDL